MSNCECTKTLACGSCKPMLAERDIWILVTTADRAGTKERLTG
jgi:hypothetical protein